MSAATTSTDYTTATTADAAIPALTAMSTTTSRPHTPPPPPLRKAPPLSRPPLGHQRERMRGSVRLWNRRGTVVERQQWMRAKAAKRVSEMGTDGKSADAGSGRPGRWNADSGGRIGSGRETLAIEWSGRRRARPASTRCCHCFTTHTAPTVTN